MTTINRDISFEYEGKRYKVLASTRFLMGLDRDLRDVTGSSLLATLKQMESAVTAAQRDPNSIEAADFPIFGMAFLIGEVLREAGLGCDDDEVFADVMQDMTENGAALVGAIIRRIGDCITPPSAGKNSQAPAQVGGKGKRKTQK